MSKRRIKLKEFQLTKEISFRWPVVRVCYQKGKEAGCESYHLWNIRGWL